MSDKNKSNAFDAISKLNQVAKNPKLAQFKDKLIWVGMIAVCLLVALTSFMPKHAAKAENDMQEKQDVSTQLKQNMAYIDSLKENKKPVLTQGYRGGDPYHPPKLRTSTPKEVLSQETLARMNAPSTFFSTALSENQTTIGKEKNPSHTLTGDNPNAIFLNQQSDITAVNAKQIPHPDLTVPAGEMIPATMETAINSELAGMTRAITTRDIYALVGNKVLIPKGSTLIGQFNSAVTQGQSRIFVVWNRVQMANGVIVTLQSPSTDSIGRAGSGADYIDRHFFERFGTGALLSVLGAYSAIGGVKSQDEYNSVAQYRMNIANSFQQAANQTFTQDLVTKPTLQINQGAMINVFVAHDLDFYTVAKRI
ncbi:TrbI/VirB10 family protein [Legionella impletisoli]|uniref:Protein LvhB10 n=1 Tax=Legionella impletisoli TaxID=343510 RepID=A0A917JQY9_9GAMM|nr:TrbI/VirB10 family protein [Legionella impletisoli]GGI82551.1 hypothetical protein GCM10007966_08980 [Legionella impletisoli]